MRKTFKILSINISEKKGEQKHSISKAILIENYGIVGDAHAGDGNRQVSLLAQEDIDTLPKNFKINFGDFAENITVSEIDFSTVKIGTLIHLGDAILQITEIGKECHHRCKIFAVLGDCVMPRKGIFAKVLKGGEITHESYCYYDI